MTLGEQLVCSRRGQLVEHIYTGHIAVADSSGAQLQFAGAPHTVAYARSAAKPLQAVALLEQPEAAALKLDEREIAVICASHSGEALHREAVASILDKIGADESALRCGIHQPYNDDEALALAAAGRKPSLLHNNCSGKHAGMLALCRLLKADAHSYDQPTHPVQQLLLGTVADMAGVSPASIVTGTDGCGVPVYGLPLSALAVAFAKLGNPDGLADERRRACGSVIGALRREPYYLAGSDRFDTALIRASGGRFVGKMGSGGVYALTAPEMRLGVAVKLMNGDMQATYAAVIEALLQLGLLSDRESRGLAEYRRPPLRNHHGALVGVVEPCFTLHSQD